MTHPFMEALSVALAAHGVSTLRFNFAYAEAGRRRPDPVRRLMAVAASALAAGEAEAAGLPLFAGGKSMGGRMISMLAASRDAQRRQDAQRMPTPDLAGLVFFGFPLHPPGRPATDRADHLARVACPMLFHQGTRDRLADLTLLRPVLEVLGARASLHLVEGGDHSFKTPKRMGRDPAGVLADLARETASWTAWAASADAASWAASAATAARTSP